MMEDIHDFHILLNAQEFLAKLRLTRYQATYQRKFHLNWSKYMGNEPPKDDLEKFYLLVLKK